MLASNTLETYPVIGRSERQIGKAGERVRLARAALLPATAAPLAAVSWIS
jgi:hypothetical protein